MTGTSKKVLLTMMLVLCMTLAGCGSEYEEEPWLQVGDTSVMEDEVMLYMIRTYGEFEELGGQDVWLAEDFSGGKAASEVAKQAAIDNLIRIKVLTNKAMELGITLEDVDEQDLSLQADRFIDGLSPGFIESFDFDRNEVTAVVRENYLASRIEERTMLDFTSNPEDESAIMLENTEYAALSTFEPREVLTTYRFHHLLVRTHTRDQAGEWKPKSLDEQEEAAGRVEQAYEEIRNGLPFEEAVVLYSDNDYITDDPDGILVSKVQLPVLYMNAVDALELGQWTDILRGEYGYHVLFLSEKNEPTQENLVLYETQFLTWEDELRQEAKSRLRDQAFQTIYNRWKESTEIDYSQPLTEFDYSTIILAGSKEQQQ